MSEAKHTPEPTSAAMRAALSLSQHGWLVKRKTLRSGAWVGDELVAQVAVDIDAATGLPDLLAACESLVEYVRYSGTELVDACVPWTELLAAIAKATSGE